MLVILLWDKLSVVTLPKQANVVLVTDLMRLLVSKRTCKTKGKHIVRVFLVHNANWLNQLLGTANLVHIGVMEEYFRKIGMGERVNTTRNENLKEIFEEIDFLSEFNNVKEN